MSGTRVQGLNVHTGALARLGVAEGRLVKAASDTRRYLAFYERRDELLSC